MMGYQQVEIRCDNEPAVMSAQKGVLDIRSKEGNKTIASTSKTRDSKSMGLVESNIRRWRAELISLKGMLEAKHARVLTPNALMWSWLARHAAWLISRYQVRSDGTTPFFALHGHSYTGEIVLFGETVHFKAPQSKSGAIRGGRILKGATSWFKGVWVGKSELNDEHVM